MSTTPRPHDLLVFVHIPKAAGTTFFRGMRRMFNDAVATRTGPLPQSVAADPVSGEVRFLRTTPYGVHELLPEREVAYVTILRDPVDRVISEYYHILETPTHRLHGRFRDEGTDLETFASEIAPNNFQTRLISGRWGGELVPEDLERAKRNLREGFAVVGITKRFDEFCVLCKMELGWRRFPYYRTSNVGQTRPRIEELPASTIELIGEHNRLDAVLFADAQEVHDAHRRRLGRDFERQLRRFRAGQSVFASWPFDRTLVARRMRRLRSRAGNLKRRLGWGLRRLKGKLRRGARATLERVRPNSPPS